MEAGCLCALMYGVGMGYDGLGEAVGTVELCLVALWKTRGRGGVALGKAGMKSWRWGGIGNLGCRSDWRGHSVSPPGCRCGRVWVG